MIRPATTFHMSAFDWGLLVLLSLLWGGAFFLSQVALAELPPFTIVFCRVTLATIALILLAVLSGQAIVLLRGAWAVVLVLGVLNCLLPFALLLWGQARIGSGLASILAATAPLFTVLVAHCLSADEKMTHARLSGVLLGLAGVAVAMGPAALDAPTDLVACFAVLGAALCYALAGVLGRRLRNMPVLPLAVGQLATTSLLSLPIALVVEKPWTLAMPGMASWTAVLALALFSTALGYLLFFRLLSLAGAINVSLVSLLVPITALLLACLVLGEPLGGSAAGGMALILAGLVVLDGRLTRPPAP